MEVIVLSPPGSWSGGNAKEETEVVNELFSNGLERFHLRKPRHSVGELRKFIERISPQYHNRIVVHSFHDLALEYKIGGIHLSERARKLRPQSRQQAEYLREKRPELRLSSSFHSLSDLRFAPTIYHYTFISPVFDSISKPHHTSAYKRGDLVAAVAQAKNKVVALGGISPDRVSDAKTMGFDGVGLLGAIWKSPDPIATYQRILSLANDDSSVAYSA